MKPTNPINSVFSSSGNNDRHTQGMYTINSKTDDCFVITFHTKTQYEEIADKLKVQYNFSNNKNNSAIIANTAVKCRKVTLTLFKTQKLMIQGAGSKVWVSTVFREISAGLQNSTELLPKSQPEKELCQTSEKTPNGKATFVPVTPYGFGPFLPKPKPSKSNSPINFLSRLFGGSNDLQTSPIFNKKGKKRCNVPENYKNIVPKPQNETDIIVDKETSCKQVDEEIFCSQPFQDEDESILSETSITTNSAGSLSNLDSPVPSYNDNNAENIPKCDQTVIEGLGKNQVHVSEKQNRGGISCIC